MLWLKRILVILGFLWRNRRQLPVIRDEAIEVGLVVKQALEDKRITKTEFRDILEQVDEVLDELKGLLI